MVSEIHFLPGFIECSVPYPRLSLCLVGHKFYTPDRMSRGTAVQLYIGMLRARLVLGVTQHDNYLNFPETFKVDSTFNYSAPTPPTE